jgi:GrpB-like predicted nucleotidyltransferase (UPF0157 family)
MTSGEDLKKVTIGSPEKLTGKIVLEEYDPAWQTIYLKEQKKIMEALPACAGRVEHVGSTSVPGLCAKPIIDILLLVPDAENESSYVPALENAGYILRIREPDWYQHRMFLGSHPAVHIHVFSDGCEEAERMIRFRDWLRTHEEDRQRYADAKRRLAAENWQYMQNYADAKTSVIHEIMNHVNGKEKSAE